MIQKTDEHFGFAPATEHDIPRIIEIKKDAWLEIYPNVDLGISKHDLEQKFSKSLDTVEIIKSYLEDPNHFYLLLLLQSSTVGYFHAQKTSLANHFSEAFISEDYRGRNLGKKAAHKVLEWLGTEKPIITEVATYNLRSINFFKALGFIVDKNIRKDPRDTWNVLPSGKVIPTVFMIKTYK